MSKLNRRNFISLAGTATAFTILKPATVFGSRLNSAIRVGIVGCGSRGSSVIENMVKHSNAQIIAMADVFHDQLQKALPRYNSANRDSGGVAVDNQKMYSGFQSCDNLLADNTVDAVLISSPAYTHPEFMEKAVRAGKHVYCEKPVAPDVKGCKQVLETGKRAEGKLSIAIGFQIRQASPYQEMVRRIHRGDIGEVLNVQLYYISSPIKKVSPKGDSHEEFMIRNHFHFRQLSGGILLDQGIHMLDVCNWVLEQNPEKSIGEGNQKGHPGFGDTFTNYQAIYNYPENLNVSIHSTQFGAKFGDVCARFIGSKGIAEAHYNRGVYIEGDNPWDSGVLRGQEPSPEQRAAGVFTSSLHDATPNKVKQFIESIETGKLINETQQGANSTLTAILGRMSALKGNKTAWKEMWESGQEYRFRVDPELFK